MAERRSLKHQRLKENIPDEAEDLLRHIYEKVQYQTTLRHLVTLFPHADLICKRLCEYILDVIPDTEDKKPLINTCLESGKIALRDSLAQWRRGEINDSQILNNFILSLVKTAMYIEQWEVKTVDGHSDNWEPENNQPLIQWWQTHKKDIEFNLKEAIDSEDDDAQTRYQKIYNSLQAYLVRDISDHALASLS